MFHFARTRSPHTGPQATGSAQGVVGRRLVRGRLRALGVVLGLCLALAVSTAVALGLSAPTSVGSLLTRDAHRHYVVNPLATIYGCFNTI
jgi:hypothetical protein